MAAAAADGASPEGAADLACHGVARMLRARLRSADAGAADPGS
jgi:hypothetical protein